MMFGLAGPFEKETPLRYANVGIAKEMYYQLDVILSITKNRETGTCF